MLCQRRFWRLARLARVPQHGARLSKCFKHLSTNANVDASVSLTDSVSGILPKFQVPGENISVLASPSDFYRSLLAMIGRAKRRILISSLYIGETESELISALSFALSRNSSLELTIHVDALRSTRPSKTQTSPAHLLLPLTTAYPGRVKVHMFRSPKLNGLLRHVVPRRFDEGWGTWHAKVYMVDDEVLLSGANLNTSYFTDRQDRYVHIASAPQLASYLSQLLRVFAGYSFSLRATPESSLGYALDWPRIDSTPFSFAVLAGKEINSFQSEAREMTSSDGPNGLAVVCPMVQSGVLGVREEEQCLYNVFECLDSGRLPGTPLVDLTSGYFALYGPYQDRVIASRSNYRIVAASPSANGFLGSKGLSGRIPAGYTLLERRFWDRVLAARRQWNEDRGIELREWQYPGWTYHAKGVWISPSSTEAPYATLFGSTNLNSRSAHLDTEISFLLSIPTECSALRTALQHEVAYIRKNAIKVDAHTFASSERRVSLMTRAIVGLVGSML